MTAPDPTTTGTPPPPFRGSPREAGDAGVDGHGAMQVGLAGVLRGLSALFWGLPMVLLAFARHFLAIVPTHYDLAFPVAACGLVFFGLVRMAPYHRRERVWQQSLVVSQMLALVATGLSPFLYFWSRMPSVPFFARAVVLLLAIALVFLVALIGTLERLAAMLPDDTVRADARMFRGVAAYVVTVFFGVAVTLYWRLSPANLSDFLEIPRQPLGLGRHALLLLLILIPVAMAMAVTWKLKEMILGAVVAGAGAGRGRPSSKT